MPQERSTRDRILQRAQDLFTTKGFANASVSEICLAAEVSPPTLYHHFGSKDGLFEEVVEKTLSIDAFLELLEKAVTEPATADARLRAYVETYLTAFPTEFLNPGLHLQDSTEVNGTSRRMVEGGVWEIYDMTRNLVRDGVASGAFRELDLDTAAACLMGMVDSFVRARVLLGAEYDLARVQACVVDLMRRGLAAPQGGQTGDELQ